MKDKKFVDNLKTRLESKDAVQRATFQSRREIKSDHQRNLGREIIIFKKPQPMSESKRN